jgi:hypothetical protein
MVPHSKAALRTKPNLAARWKESIVQMLELYGKDNQTSARHFHQMVELCFFTDDSQEGVVVRGRAPLDQPLYAKVRKDPRFRYVAQEATESRPVPFTLPDEAAINAEYARLGGPLTTEDVVVKTERPYVSGFMPPKLAKVFHAIVNQDTDLMCVLDRLNQMPLTFGFQGFRDLSSHGKRYPLQGRPNITTYVNMDTGYPDTVGLPEEFLSMRYVRVVDMKHGRQAKGYLYPLVLSCLRKAHAALNGVGVKVVSPP